MGYSLNRCFSKKDIQISNRCGTINITHQGNVDQHYCAIPPHSTKNCNYNKDKKISASEGGSHTAFTNIN